MLPPNKTTPRLLELQAKLKQAESTLSAWPQPTRDDVVLIGGVVLLYSYVDFQLGRLFEALKHGNLLPASVRDKANRLSAWEIAKAVREAPVWSDPIDIDVLTELESYRSLRNLIAHFAIRRFPEDDAFLFVTKNVKDFKNILGVEPDVGVAMTAIAEVLQVKNSLRRIEFIHTWLAQIVPQFERQLLPRR